MLTDARPGIVAVREASCLALFLRPCPVREFAERGRAEAAAWLVGLPEGPGASVRLRSNAVGPLAAYAVTQAWTDEVGAMNGEWQRHSPPVRLPRRPTDRVEDVAAWALTILGVLTAVLVVTTGVRLHDEGMHRIGVETRDRMQVQAVLLEPANPNAAGERPPGVRVVAVPASIRYLAPDGAEHVVDLPVTGAVHAGRAVPLWVDRSGQVVGAPGHTVDAVGRAAVGAVGIALIGALIVGGSWAGVSAATRRVNMARWEREWMQVEPRWSGRTRS